MEHLEATNRFTCSNKMHKGIQEKKKKCFVTASRLLAAARGQALTRYDQRQLHLVEQDERKEGLSD